MSENLELSGHTSTVWHEAIRVHMLANLTYRILSACAFGLRLSPLKEVELAPSLPRHVVPQDKIRIGSADREAVANALKEERELAVLRVPLPLLAVDHSSSVRIERPGLGLARRRNAVMGDFARAWRRLLADVH